MGRSRGGQMGNVSLDPLGRARRCTPGLPIRLLRSWAGVHSPFPVRSDGAPGRGRVQSWCPVLLNARGTPRGDSQPRLPGACLTPSKGRKSHSWSVTTGPRQCRRDGGIGRRGGLKNLWASALAGSSPAPGILLKGNDLYYQQVPPNFAENGPICRAVTRCGDNAVTNRTFRASVFMPAAAPRSAHSSSYSNRYSTWGSRRRLVRRCAYLSSRSCTPE